MHACAACHETPHIRILAQVAAVYYRLHCAHCLQIAAEEQQLAELDSAHKAAQIEVTRAAADLRALQAERHSVTGQWQTTIEACTR